MSKHGLYYQLVKRQTEQNEQELKIYSEDTNPKTTISIDVPITDKPYSTSFTGKESI